MHVAIRAFMPYAIVKLFSQKLTSLLFSRFHEIHENFEPRKFGATMYTVFCILCLTLFSAPIQLLSVIPVLQACNDQNLQLTQGFFTSLLDYYCFSGSLSRIF